MMHESTFDGTFAYVAKLMSELRQALLSDEPAEFKIHLHLAQDRLGYPAPAVAAAAALEELMRMAIRHARENPREPRAALKFELIKTVGRNPGHRETLKWMGGQ